jgi:ribosomal protein S12 methylthiotransferase
MRGDLVSRPIHEVLQEAENLFKAGVKELLVISQDTSAYGVDVKFRTGFWNGRPVKTHMTQLTEALGALAKQYGAWVRLHYVYPYPHVDQVIPMMGDGHVLPYLDIPLQHAHPDVLKRMKRPASGEKNLERIQAWRKMNPDLVIRSTFIAGFPGETEEEFEYLLDFLKEAQIDRLGCFAYSPVEGATANELENPVPEAVREERRARVMLLQEEISLKRQQAKVGKTLRVLVDEVGPREAIGRTAADAPEIDGVVHIKRALTPGKAKPAVGEFIDVVVTKADAHDLWATVA